MIDYNTKTARIAEPKLAVSYVGEYGIFVPSDLDCKMHKMLMSKELFIEAYNKYIMNNEDVATSAQWLIDPDGYYPYCSNCNKEPKNGDMTPYCPICGKKMINMKKRG